MYINLLLAFLEPAVVAVPARADSVVEAVEGETVGGVIAGVVGVDDDVIAGVVGVDDDVIAGVNDVDAIENDIVGRAVCCVRGGDDARELLLEGLEEEGEYSMGLLELRHILAIGSGDGAACANIVTSGAADDNND